jgi:hypothetical protein
MISGAADTSGLQRSEQTEIRPDAMSHWRARHPNHLVTAARNTRRIEQTDSETRRATSDRTSGGPSSHV